jgi:tetratricopeptide (TPR) repeat protein
MGSMSDRALRLLCVAALALSCATTAQQHLAAGKRAVEAGDTEAAQHELEAGRALEQKAPTGALVPLDIELGDLYVTYPELGHEADVEGLYKEALALAEKGYGNDDTKYAAVLQRLGDYYLIQERYADAVPILERFLAASRAHWTVDQTYQSSQASGLAKAYGAVGRGADQAKLRELIDEPLARKALATQPPAKGLAAAAAAAQPRPVAEIAKSELYLEPNATDREGKPMFVHFTERDMPLRVSIALPDTPATDGSAAQTRDAATQGIREWEGAVRRVLPWFNLAIEDDEPSAGAGGLDPTPARLRCRLRRDQLDESGTEPRTRRRHSVDPTAQIPEARSLGQVYANAVHAFGGALGLGYCWSATPSAAWPGSSATGSRRPTWTCARCRRWRRSPAASARRRPAARAGVLADLPFLNVGGSGVFIDLARPTRRRSWCSSTRARRAVVTPATPRWASGA